MEMEPTCMALGLCQVAAAIPMIGKGQGRSTASATTAAGGLRVSRVSIQMHTLGPGTCTMTTTDRTGSHASRQTGFPSGASRTQALSVSIVLEATDTITVVLMVAVAPYYVVIGFIQVAVPCLVWMFALGRRPPVAGFPNVIEFTIEDVEV